MNTLSTSAPWNGYCLPMAPMEPAFHADLMPHQTEVIRRAVRERTYLIAHEQGTGKTITGIMLAQSAHNAGVRPVLVVCPPSLTWNWKKEFAKWAPELTTTILNKRKPLDTQLSNAQGLPDADVIIATDGSLAGYNRWFIGGAQKFTWDDENAKDDFGNRIVPDYFIRDFGQGVGALIVDECQRVSSQRAGRGRAFNHLCASRPEMAKWLLSGTPFTKTRVGLWNLMQGLATFDRHNIDGVVCDSRTWLDHFAPAVDSYGARGQAFTEDLHAQMFHPVTGWAHRVRTADVIADLPNMGRILRDGQLQGEWASKYKRAEENLEQWLIDTRGHAKAESMMKAEALIRVQELRRLVGKAKVESVIAHIELTLDSAEAGDHEPVLVLATHTDIREGIMEHFVKAGLRVGTIHGSMTAEAKQAVVDGWQEKQYDIVVANVISASVGFTMTEGRHIVFAELPWNSADVVQAEARLLRKGQERDVCSQVVLGVQTSGKRTIDDRLWGLLEGKFREAKAVMDGEMVETMVGDDEQSLAMAILNSYLADL
jgi:SNF2 family DNA or RNA helicase